MKKFIFLCGLLFLLGSISFSETNFPSGQATAEGAACDMARAFINADKNLWRSVNNSLLLEKKSELKNFVEDMARQMEKMSEVSFEKRPGPKEIKQVYQARQLTRQGPASYGYASFNFKNVEFVDVVVIQADGQPSLNRTLVIEDTDGKWYVLPRPDLYPLLSEGLNSEEPSVGLWEER